MKVIIDDIMKPVVVCGVVDHIIVKKIEIEGSYLEIIEVLERLGLKTEKDYGKT